MIRRFESNSTPLRVCVCTSYSAGAEPRAPRHAVAIALLNPTYEVTFVECVPRGVEKDAYDPFIGRPNIHRVFHQFAARTSQPGRLAFDKVARLIARLQFRLFKALRPQALNTRFCDFESTLRRIDASVYMGHNIETLVPVYRVAQERHALAMFDCMEFYSDMGDSQNELDRRIIRAMEQRYLPRCALVVASSVEMADALCAQYSIRRPLPLHNVPSREPHVHKCVHEGLSLYWRNSVLGFGQRGLKDALQALVYLPEDVSLHLQGRLQSDGGAELRRRIASLGLTNRIFLHPPYSPPAAVLEASKYCVGLCLEHAGIRNHDLTISNKIFDYLMGGLVVVASDLSGLRGVVERSRGGILFRPGDASDLAAKITLLRNAQSLRLRLARNARQFALVEGNRENEMRRFQEAFTSCTTRERS